MSALSQADIINGFALKLFNQLSTGKDANFFVSPFSIVIALSMVLNGARNDTLNQLKNILNMNSLSIPEINGLQHEYLSNLTRLIKSKRNSVVLDSANKIYSKKEYQLKPEFVNDLLNYYSSQIEPMDFTKSEEAANEINEWIANKTNNKIKDLISPSLLNELTRIILVNAIYFKGNWLYPFNEKLTQKDDFEMRDGTTVQIDMMKLSQKRLLYKKNPAGLNASTCELPYAGNSISMTIILPDEGVNIEDVEKELDLKTLASVFEKDALESVNVYLPRFKLNYKADV